MSIPAETLSALARESGRLLGELGVRPEDEKWIRAHAETIRSLAGGQKRSRLRDLFYGFSVFARRALRTAK